MLLASGLAMFCLSSILLWWYINVFQMKTCDFLYKKIKKFKKKCRLNRLELIKLEFWFSPWVLRVFSPWVFSNGQKKPGLVSKYGEAHRPNKKPASYLPEWRQVDDDVFRKTCISNKNNYCSPHAVFFKPRQTIKYNRGISKF